MQSYLGQTFDGGLLGHGQVAVWLEIMGKYVHPENPVFEGLIFIQTISIGASDS